MNKLTKSSFNNYLACPKEYWLAHHHPDEIVSTWDEAAKFRARQGYEVEAKVKELLTSRGDREYVFQKAVETEKLIARFDVFVEDEVTDTTHIYEVKSSKFIGKDHKQKGKRDKREGFLYDLGFQVYAARESGIDVSKAMLVSVFGEYVRNGELDLDELLVFEDVTEEIETLQPMIGTHIENAFRVLESEPKVDFENLCGNQLRCEFLKFALPDFPERTVKEIQGLRGAKYTGLLDEGILDIYDVPNDYELTEKQRDYVDLVQAGAIVFDREAIREWIDGLEYPLYFLDYESVNPAIPEFDRTKSYEQITFQYSLHLKETAQSELRHQEFLSDGMDDVAKSVAAHLAEENWREGKRCGLE